MGDARLVREALGVAIPRGIAFGALVMLISVGFLQETSILRADIPVNGSRQELIDEYGFIFNLGFSCLVAGIIRIMFGFCWRAACCARACLRTLRGCCRWASTWLQDEEAPDECSGGEALVYAQARPLFKKRFREL